jgi:hypothetical protein
VALARASKVLENQQQEKDKYNSRDGLGKELPELARYLTHWSWSASHIEILSI